MSSIIICNFAILIRIVTLGMIQHTTQGKTNEDLSQKKKIKVAKLYKMFPMNVFIHFCSDKIGFSLIELILKSMLN